MKLFWDLYIPQNIIAYFYIDFLIVVVCYLVFYFYIIQENFHWFWKEKTKILTMIDINLDIKFGAIKIRFLLSTTFIKVLNAIKYQNYISDPNSFSI